MLINGEVFKDNDFWMAEIPWLDLLIQSETKMAIPFMVKDAIETLVNDKSFSIKVIMKKDNLYISTNNLKKLIGLILKRLRLKNSLRLEDVAKKLLAKSVNEYAQYEQAKHLPSIEKFDKLIKAIDPKLKPVITLR